MARPLRFSPTHLETVAAALGTAEGLTGRFYCIPSREWERLPYDVTTLASGEPLREDAFAEVVRVLPPARPAESRHRGGIPEHFRIRLRDDAILSATADPNRELELFSLLLWVLTHELVHVVRFGSGLAPFEAAPEARLQEEHRVHRITRRVLEPALDGPLQRAGRMLFRARF